MNKANEIENLKKEMFRNKIITNMLQAENAELKKINKGIREAYDNVNNINLKYHRYFPYIDRLRKTLIFKVLRKFRRSSYEK